MMSFSYPITCTTHRKHWTAHIEMDIFIQTGGTLSQVSMYVQNDHIIVGVPGDISFPSCTMGCQRLKMTSH